MTGDDAYVPEGLAVAATRIVCGRDVNMHTTSAVAASQWSSLGIEAGFHTGNFRNRFGIDITRYDGIDMQFELKGVSCAVVNSLRRIMTSEAPTMAIESVFIANNTSVIQDEVLSHRLGLLPLKVDPRVFQYKAKEDPPCEHNTVVLKLEVHCKRLPSGEIENDKVYSKHLQWLPEGSEMPEETACRFACSQASIVPTGVQPVHDDILLARLRPGQSIELECHCIKGVGDEHAKWSPVATTWYRLLPEVLLLKQPEKQLAHELVQQLPGLLQLVEHGSHLQLVVTDVREHLNLLEKVRHMACEERYAPYLQLRKVKDHFLFNIESTGAWKPHELFAYAVQLMLSKCDKILDGLQSCTD